MKVDNRPVSVGEFKYIYEKTTAKKPPTPKKHSRIPGSVFQIQTQSSQARDLKLDTIQSLNDELNGYKRQLANSYLTDREIMDHLLKELQERQKRRHPV